MRALLVFIVLGLLYVLIRSSTNLDFDLSGTNPVLIGYGALFTAGIVAAELLRPFLSLMAPLSRFVVVAVLAGLVWAGFEQARTAGNLPEGLLDPTAGLETNGEPIRQTRLPVAWDGLHRAVAQINNQSVGVLIETGTPLVVLQYEEAERLGFNLENLTFTSRVPVSDRNITAALMPFLSVRIDDVELFEVDAAIAAPGMVDTSLIGLSFLNRLETVGLIDGELLLRQ